MLDVSRIDDQVICRLTPVAVEATAQHTAIISWNRSVPVTPELVREMVSQHRAIIEFNRDLLERMKEAVG